MDWVGSRILFGLSQNLSLYQAYNMLPSQLLGLCHGENVVYVDNQLHSQLSQLSSKWL